MAIFLPVAPPRMLKALGDYHGYFYLAHEVVKDPQAYRDLYDHALAHRPSGIHTILDNSVIELGGAVDLSMVEEALFITQANVVVLPDVLEDGKATAAATISAYSEWQTVLGEVKPDVQLMIVPQGETLEDWVQCLERILKDCPKASHQWIGIPRNTTGRIVGSRRYLVSVVKMLAPLCKIHLLGFSDNMIDDLVSATQPGVDSIDSAVPCRTTNFWLGCQTEPRPADWWDTGELTWEHMNNVHYINNLAQRTRLY